MLVKQRKELILNLLRKEGQVIAKDLAKTLDLSEDTIRRDLRELAKEGLLQRVHGGALPVSSAISDVATRQNIAIEAKQTIARTAATLIHPGQIIILDGGTTTTQLVRLLPETLEITVVTHSPGIAVELVNHPLIDVILIGGKLFKHSVVTVGAIALEALSHIRADTYFMGVTGVHPDAGLSTGDLEEAYMKKALSERAADTFVLASKEKLGVASAYVIKPVTEISGIVVERAAPERLVGPYRELGVEMYTD